MSEHEMADGIFPISPDNARALYSAVRDRLATRFHAAPSLQSRLAVIGTEHLLSLSAAEPLRQCGQRVLLYGPSGCGKTTAARALAEALGLPFAGCWDMTGVVEVGYRGVDVQCLMRQLLQLNGGDVERTETSVLAIDELSHLATTSREDTVGNAVRIGQQTSLLPLLSSDGEIRFSMDVSQAQREVVIRTRRMLIIACGVFEGVGDNATTADFERFGLIRELAERLGSIIELPEPSRAVLESLYGECAEALRERHALFGFELVIPRETITCVARAVAAGVGGAGTRSGFAWLEDAAQRRLLYMLDCRAREGARSVLSPDDLFAALPTLRASRRRPRY
jgi:ATP-dependent protease Clp ATPase subunit